jgi:DNA-binding MarR family transcriptional regulator/N-acetylglutamate synthase-like GNAT family acetyltransferase
MALSHTTADLRRFARNFTRVTGLLRPRLYGVDLSLAEARLIYEMHQSCGVTATTLQHIMRLDAGYLSRMISRLEKRGLVRRTLSGEDGRARPLELTDDGKALFRRIDQSSTKEMETMIAHLSSDERVELSAALAKVEWLVDPAAARGVFAIRTHRTGDLGWIVHRHAMLYSQEYGWDISFEGAVAGIVADFIQSYDPAYERCFVAERANGIVGSAIVVRKDYEKAKLRLVYVEPVARGLGVGETLVTASMDFARMAGYRQMVLWTNDVLKPARRLYERLGFRLILSEAHRNFGKDLIGETWEVTL